MAIPTILPSMSSATVTAPLESPRQVRHRSAGANPRIAYRRLSWLRLPLGKSPSWHSPQKHLVCRRGQRARGRCDSN
jgi:hypothetical protein